MGPWSQLQKLSDGMNVRKERDGDDEMEAGDDEADDDESGETETTEAAAS